MKVEVRIPVSPTPHFFRQIEYLSRAFAAYGGLAANARFRVSVGDDCEPYDLAALNPWGGKRVDWHWADREQFRAISYNATNLDRFQSESDADIVMLLDADTMLVRNVDDVLEALVAEPP